MTTSIKRPAIDGLTRTLRTSLWLRIRSDVPYRTLGPHTHENNSHPQIFRRDEVPLQYRPPARLENRRQNFELWTPPASCHKTNWESLKALFQTYIGLMPLKPPLDRRYCLNLLTTFHLASTLSHLSHRLSSTTFHLKTLDNKGHCKSRYGIDKFAIGQDQMY